MAANDTIADMLTRIRNANLARHQTTQIPATKMTRSIALQSASEEGFIAEIQEVGEGVKRNLVVSLKYKEKSPTDHHLKRVSKPGLRCTQIEKNYHGYSVASVLRLFPPQAES